MLSVVSGNFIIFATVAGMIIIFIWLIYRISEFRKRSKEIDERAREISAMSPPVAIKKARSAPDRTILETPAVGLLIVMHREGISPARGMFVASVEKGRAGLIVTTEDPRSIPVAPTVKKIWMNRSSVNGDLENTVVVNPTNLSGTLDEIATFTANANGSSVVLLDRFDDVITSNDVPRVVKFLNMLRERSAKDRMSILVPIGYRAIPQRVRNQFIEAFETVVV